MPEQTYVREYSGCEDCHVDFVTPDVDYTFTECPCGSGKIPAPGGLKPIHRKPPLEE